MAAGRRLSATVKGLLMAQVGHGLSQRFNADPGGQVLLFLLMPAAVRYMMVSSLRKGCSSISLLSNSNICFSIPNFTSCACYIRTLIFVSGLEVVDGADDFHHLCRGADIVQNILHPLVCHRALIQGGLAH